jgi:hypothetical protein
MRRRDFITLIGVAAVWPVAVAITAVSLADHPQRPK